MDTGLIHIYCGDGKGKTTASLGLTMRCAGHGGRILYVQFLKSRPTGELKMLDLLPGVTVLRGQGITKFTFQMSEAEKAAARQEHEQLFDKICQACRDDSLQLLVLDEVIGACNTGLFDEAALVRFLKTKPRDLEVVLTGRDPSPQLVALADYVSEICKCKHPYDKGITARDGIEQ